MATIGLWSRTPLDSSSSRRSSVSSVASSSGAAYDLRDAGTETNCASSWRRSTLTASAQGAKPGRRQARKEAASTAEPRRAPRTRHCKRSREATRALRRHRRTSAPNEEANPNSSQNSSLPSVHASASGPRDRFRTKPATAVTPSREPESRQSPIAGREKVLREERAPYAAHWRPVATRFRSEARWTRSWGTGRGVRRLVAASRGGGLAVDVPAVAVPANGPVLGDAGRAA